jgi:hypothetical protein
MGGVVQAETPITFRDLVASNVSRLREAAQVTVDRVVKAAQSLGLEWNASWLRGVEQGTRTLTGEELIALPVVLSTALAHRVTLADLLLGDAPIVVKPNSAPIAAPYLREIITGAPYRRHFADVAQDATAMLIASNAAAVEKMRTIRLANLSDVDVRTLGRAEAGSGTAESRLARRLDVPEIIVIAAAASLWGRSLSDERDALVRHNGAKQSLATITRRLSNEVTRRINEAANANAGTKPSAKPGIKPAIKPGIKPAIKPSTKPAKHASLTESLRDAS